MGRERKRGNGMRVRGKGGGEMAERGREEGGEEEE